VAHDPLVVVALLTPFDERGRFDRDALDSHVDWLIEAGVDGLMPCGTTGEGPLLADDELLDVVAATVDAARGRVSVIAHIGRADTHTTARLAESVLAGGIDGISAVVPYYYRCSDDEILEHFRAVLRTAVDVPTYAYTIPERTGNQLSPGVVRALAAEGLRGVKDSTKSMERHREYLACGVDVLIGTDAFVLEAFRAGAAGCVSALANVRPDLLVALRDGGGAAVQQEILELRAETPFRALKRALAGRGYPPAYRAPLA
jgi:4-hydroxy-tetrahydrodipicolinate synthase